MPPRSRVAIWCEAIWSFLAWPPWMAGMSRACPETKARPSCAQRSARQVPGEQAFDRDDETLTVGSNRREKRFRSGLPRTVQQGLTIGAHDTDGHGPRMPGDAAVTWVWGGGDAPEILGRRTRRTRAAGVKRRHTATPQVAEPRTKESNAGDPRGDPYGSGHATPADPVVGLCPWRPDLDAWRPDRGGAAATSTHDASRGHPWPG
jgi:hypothetical protein